MSNKHNHSKKGQWSDTYKRWARMIRRCTNPNHEHYQHYGGRGITVCDRWREFVNFLDDMGEAPPGLQLDRIDNNQGYCKQNCRWVTPKQNSRNRRSNYLITYCGKTRCLTEWAEYYGIPNTTLRRRIEEYGWSIEKALTTSPKHPRERKQNNGI